MTDPAISIVIPVLNEEATIASFLRPLQLLREAGVELVVADGGSKDGTTELARPLCDQLISSDKGRALQMNAGAASAKGDILVFLHADTELPPAFLKVMQDFKLANPVWGRFDVRLSGNRRVFRIISYMINLRSRVTGISTGDQAQFMTRVAFEQVGGFPEIPLMEDVAMSKRLLRLAKPYCPPEQVTTSSRRWEEQGVWKTILLMWKLRLKYFLGVPPEQLVREYYG